MSYTSIKEGGFATVRVFEPTFISFDDFKISLSGELLLP